MPYSNPEADQLSRLVYDFILAPITEGKHSKEEMEIMKTIASFLRNLKDINSVLSQVSTTKDTLFTNMIIWADESRPAEDVGNQKLISIMELFNVNLSDEEWLSFVTSVTEANFMLLLGLCSTSLATEVLIRTTRAITNHPTFINELYVISEVLLNAQCRLTSQAVKNQNLPEIHGLYALESIFKCTGITGIKTILETQKTYPQFILQQLLKLDLLKQFARHLKHINSDYAHDFFQTTFNELVVDNMNLLGLSVFHRKADVFRFLLEECRVNPRLAGDFMSDGDCISLLLTMCCESSEYHAFFISVLPWLQNYVQDYNKDKSTELLIHHPYKTDINFCPLVFILSKHGGRSFLHDYIIKTPEINWLPHLSSRNVKSFYPLWIPYISPYYSFDTSDLTNYVDATRNSKYKIDSTKLIYSLVKSIQMVNDLHANDDQQKRLLYAFSRQVLHNILKHPELFKILTTYVKDPLDPEENTLQQLNLFFTDKAILKNLQVIGKELSRTNLIPLLTIYGVLLVINKQCNEESIKFLLAIDQPGEVLRPVLSGLECIFKSLPDLNYLNEIIDHYGFNKLESNLWADLKRMTRGLLNTALSMKERLAEKLKTTREKKENSDSSESKMAVIDTPEHTLEMRINWLQFSLDGVPSTSPLKQEKIDTDLKAVATELTQYRGSKLKQFTEDLKKLQAIRREQYIEQGGNLELKVAPPKEPVKKKKTGIKLGKSNATKSGALQLAVSSTLNDHIAPGPKELVAPAPKVDSVAPGELAESVPSVEKINSVIPPQKVTPKVPGKKIKSAAAKPKARHAKPEKKNLVSPIQKSMVQLLETEIGKIESPAASEPKVELVETTNNEIESPVHEPKLEVAEPEKNEIKPHILESKVELVETEILQTEANLLNLKIELSDEIEVISVLSEQDEANSAKFGSIPDSSDLPSPKVAWFKLFEHNKPELVASESDLNPQSNTTMDKEDAFSAYNLIYFKQMVIDLSQFINQLAFQQMHTEVDPLEFASLEHAKYYINQLIIMIQTQFPQYCYESPDSEEKPNDSLPDKGFHQKGKINHLLDIMMLSSDKDLTRVDKFALEYKRLEIKQGKTLKDKTGVFHLWNHFISSHLKTLTRMQTLTAEFQNSINELLQNFVSTLHHSFLPTRLKTEEEHDVYNQFFRFPVFLNDMLQMTHLGACIETNEVGSQVCGYLEDLPRSDTDFYTQVHLNEEVRFEQFKAYLSQCITQNLHPGDKAKLAYETEDSIHYILTIGGHPIDWVISTDSFKKSVSKRRMPAAMLSLNLLTGTIFNPDISFDSKKLVRLCHYQENQLSDIPSEELDSWVNDTTIIPFILRMLAKTYTSHPLRTYENLQLATLLRRAAMSFAYGPQEPFKGNILTTLLGKSSLVLAGLHHRLFVDNLVFIFGLSIEKDLDYLIRVQRVFQQEENVEPGWSRPCMKKFTSVDYIALMLHRFLRNSLADTNDTASTTEKYSRMWEMACKCLKQPWADQAYNLVVEIELYLTGQRIKSPEVCRVFDLKEFYTPKRSLNFAPFTQVHASGNSFSLFQPGYPDMRPSMPHFDSLFEPS